MNPEPCWFPHGFKGIQRIGGECRPQQKHYISYTLQSRSADSLITVSAIDLKLINRNIQVIGVSMECGAAMYESIRIGKPIKVEELPSLADKPGGRIGLDNDFAFDAVQTLVDESTLDSDKEIYQANRNTCLEDRQIIKYVRAVRISALLARKINSK